MKMAGVRPLACAEPSHMPPRTPSQMYVSALRREVKQEVRVLERQIQQG